MPDQVFLEQSESLNNQESSGAVGLRGGRDLTFGFRALSTNNNGLVSSLYRILANHSFLAVAIILVGTFVRLIHLAIVDLQAPFEYGGLYIEFAEQIVANNYQIPNRIPFYTDGGIPFAYPPLPFYVEAVLLDIFSAPKFSVVNLLPPAIAILALPSFHYLTREIGMEAWQRLAALAAFALIQSAWVAQTEGAGLAESFGTLALIWLAFSLVRAYKREGAATGYGLAGLVWGLCILASPGSAYASFPTVLIFVASQFARDGWRLRFQMVRLMAMTGLVALAISSPYWVAVVLNHGFGVFVDPFLDQHGGIQNSLKEIARNVTNFTVSTGRRPFFWRVAILTGIVYTVMTRRWALPVWFVIIFNLPREGAWMSSIPAALLTGFGAVESLKAMMRFGRRQLPRYQAHLIVGGFVLFIALLTGVNTFPVTIERAHAGADAFGDVSFQYSESAMEWVEMNTPVEGKFVVLASGPVEEWFPQIARRTMLNGLWGSEWEPEDRIRISALRRRLAACRDLECIRHSVEEIMGYGDVYLYAEVKKLPKPDVTQADGESTASVFEELWRQNGIVIGHLSER